MQDQDPLIAEIYEAAFLPERWDGVLDAMARSIGGEGALLFSARDSFTRYRASDGVRPLVDRLLGEGWLSRGNHRTDRLMANGLSAGFLNEADHVTEAEYRTYPVYTDLMRPLGLGLGAGTVIASPSGDRLAFSVERSLAADPFRPADIARLDRLRPHLARASLMASRLAFERLQAAIQALELVGFPAAILAADGIALAATKGFDDHRPDLRIGRGDRVVFRRPDAARRLARALADLRQGGAGASFALPADGDAPPAVVHIVPVEREARDLFQHAACFLVISAVERDRIPGADLIQGLFDLTPAEARVAARLGAGEDVAGIAATSGLSPDTIRTQVRAVLGKAGLSRQVDLVAAIASIRTPPPKPPSD